MKNTVSETIRVVIADDMPIFREMVVATLEGEDDIEVVGEASDGQDALAAFEQLATRRPADQLVAMHLARLQAGHTGDLIVLDGK